MIFDCSRRCGASQTYESESNDNNNNTLKRPNKYDVNSGLTAILSNFEDFSISNSATHDEWLTRSILKMFENSCKSCEYSLRELMFGILELLTSKNQFSYW